MGRIIQMSCVKKEIFLIKEFVRYLSSNNLWPIWKASKLEIHLLLKRKTFPLEIAFKIFFARLFLFLTLSQILAQCFVSIRKEREKRYVFVVDFKIITDEVFENTLTSLRKLTSDIQIFSGLGLLFVVRLATKVLFWTRFWYSFGHFFIFLNNLVLFFCSLPLFCCFQIPKRLRCCLFLFLLGSFLLREGFWDLNKLLWKLFVLEVQLLAFEFLNDIDISWMLIGKFSVVIVSLRG